MPTYKAEPQNLADLLFLYKKHLETTESPEKAKATYEQTITALTRYTLPGWGHPSPAGRKPTVLETQSANLFLSNTSLEKLKDAQTAQQKTFDDLKANSAQRSTNRSRLNQLMTWVKQQGWLDDNKSTDNRVKRKFYDEHGNPNDKKLTNRKHLPKYSLKIKDASPSLIAEIEEFKKFLTNPYYPGRNFKALKEGSSIDIVIQKLCEILGWFFQQKQIHRELSLEMLIPKPKYSREDNPIEFLRESKKIGKEVDSLLCDYINFLKTERKCNSNTIVTNLRPILSLAKYHYCDETEDDNYRDVPAVTIIRKHVNSLIRQGKNEEAASDISKKWLDLPDVINKIVLPLREMTNYKYISNGVRDITTIAASFSDFIIWVMLTFRPPRRQQEICDCKIGLSCLLPNKSERDKFLQITKDKVIHPLPNNRNEELKYGYLYKDFTDKWYVDTPAESYKTGDTYGHQKLEVPNPKFPDGKCFYDYLEAYLYGYWRDKKGNWLSAGQVSNDELDNKSWQLYSLRMAHNPQHNHVFFGDDKAMPYTAGNFYYMFSRLAHTLTGQRLNPHLLRDIYATWFLDQGYTQDRIASLAYAMGHSEAMLRKDYDKRKSHQKNRPIEEELGKLMNQFINNTYTSSPSLPTGSSSAASTPKPTQQDIDRIMAVLTPEQKRQLGFD